MGNLAAFYFYDSRLMEFEEGGIVTGERGDVGGEKFGCNFKN